MSAAGPPRSPLLAATSETAAALAARHGAAGDRPDLRKDLIIRRQVQMGEVSWVVKNPETVKYYFFDDSDWGLIELFDGTRTRPEIFEDYRARYPHAEIEYSLVLDYEEMLRKLEMIQQSVAERNLALLSKFKTARQRAAEEKAEGFNIFFLLFHVLDPNRFLDRTVRYVRWIWTWPVVLISMIFFLWTIGVFVSHWDPIWTGTIELYSFLKKPLLDAIQFFCLLSIIGCIHEFSHAYATKIYGGEVHDIGIALLYFTPAFYCDTTDSLLFENKWHKLWVTTAGIYVEAFMCSVATAVWVASYPDTLLNELAYKTMLFTGISTVFFNINPLIKIDGYYALSSILEISELREESFRYIGAFLQKKVLRLPVELPAVSRRKRRIYLIYGTLALAWMGTIMAFIAGLLNNFYSKYFGDFAVVLLLLTLYHFFRKRVRLVTRTARAFYLDKKELLMSRRSRIPLLIAAAALLLLLFVPWTRRKVSAEALLEPEKQVRLEAPEDAIVLEVLAREGEAVRAGQPIFRLGSPAAEAERGELAARRDLLEKQASGARESGTPEEVFGSESRKSSLDVAITSDRARRKRLLVLSPVAGRLLTPRLDDLKGRFVPEGALLAEVGDCRRMTAELAVSERLLDDLERGAPVSVMLRSDRLSILRGKISSISSATLDQPRTAGERVEPTAPSDRPDRFVALTVFENPDGTLLPGMIGRAKIYAKRASFAARAWRVLSRWLQMVIW